MVIVHGEDEEIETGLKKFGAMIGDHVEVGCGSVLNPGTVIGRETEYLSAVQCKGMRKQPFDLQEAGRNCRKEIRQKSNREDFGNYPLAVNRVKYQSTVMIV